MVTAKCEAKNMQYWESEGTRPQFTGGSWEGGVALTDLSQKYLSRCFHHPFQSLDEIRAGQFDRIRFLVDLAYREIPVYAEKYRAAGFHPNDLRSWQDYERLPVITKDELVEAFPERCVSRRWPLEELFSTRSSGSSGKTLLIKVNEEAILVDTLQGVRQFWLQSGLKYGRDHLTAHIYTVPWWFDKVGDSFPTAFISSLIAPDAISDILGELKPQVISCYPTNLKAIMPYWGRFDHSDIYLAVIHSEGSTRIERREWSKDLGIPVLDEYSSEEATRIALELPCGHYHVCEDSVYLEVLDPQTHQAKADGEAGLAVVTNLLNEAMPFIRYCQGDYVTRPRSADRCLVGWSQLASVDGRVNDSFINRYGRVIPAGTILDVSYRWMFDVGIHLKGFELIQKQPDEIQAVLTVDDHVAAAMVQSSLDHLQKLLHVCMSHPVIVDAEVTRNLPKREGKSRPIRRAFAA